MGPHPPSPLRLNLFASAPSRARRQASLRKAPPVEEDEPTRSPTAVVGPSPNSSPPDSTPANPSQNSPSAPMPVSGPSASSSPPDGPQRRTRSSEPSPSRPSPPLSLTEISRWASGRAPDLLDVLRGGEVDGLASVVVGDDGCETANCRPLSAIRRRLA